MTARKALRAYAASVWDGNGNRITVYAAGTSIPEVRRWTERHVARLGWKPAPDAPAAVAAAVAAPDTIRGMVFTPDGQLRIDRNDDPALDAAVAHLYDLGGIELGFVGKGYRPVRARAVWLPGDLLATLPIAHGGREIGSIYAGGTGTWLAGLDPADIDDAVTRVQRLARQFDTRVGEAL